MASISKERIEQLIAKQKKDFLADYQKLVEIPSVSAQQAHRKDIDRTAELACQFLEKAGAKTKIYQTKGNPVIWGRIERKAGAPTLGIYAHLDVQPAEMGKDGWTMEPFCFKEDGGRFYGRGTTDDKGPAMTALWAAQMAGEFDIPLNFEFIWEFEEEIGSPSFVGFLNEAKSQITADSILISDTIWLAAGKPALTEGLRGLVGFLIRLRTAEKDGHSGMTGGAARNPLTELCEVIAGCVDGQTGKIKIEGLDKTWTPVSNEVRQGFVQAGFSVENFKSAHQLKTLRSEDPAEVATRIWAAPTFEVHGLVGGYQGDGLKTVVPPFAEAKLSLRIVPDQNPDQIFELVKKHIAKLNPDVEVIPEHFLKPYAAPSGLPLQEKVRDAVEFGFNVRPSGVREGGSIGAVVSMDEILKKPILFMGLSLPEDSYHGPNESFAWGQIEGGVKAFLKYFELIAKT